MTPPWNTEDLKKCEKYDKLVTEGKMRWRVVEIHNLINKDE